MKRGSIFERVGVKRLRWNRFNLSHSVKQSFKMGQLVPIMCKEVLPGDKWNISLQNMLRFAPLVSPVMHEVKVTTHAYFVPNRILWPDWEDFITGAESVDLPTVIHNSGVEEGDLGCYLGYPIITQAGITPNVSAFPLAAYNKIFNEYYRDQNLVAELPDELISGDNSVQFFSTLGGAPQNRAWNHDYLTSCLPFAQKGDAALLPLGTFMDVDVDLVQGQIPPVFQQVRDVNGNLLTGNEPLRADDPNGVLVAGSTSSSVTAFIDPNGSLRARTSDLEAMASDIKDVRRAFMLQEFLELSARGGTRYTEVLRNFFEQISSDKRLQRPEYIGGAYQNMVISEVLSTAQTDSNNTVTPVGNLAGHGISVGGSRGISYRAEEHGWIMIIINVQPISAYQQGIPREYSREGRLDYYWPQFALIGEQGVLNKEVMVDQANNADLDEVFGYIPRYAEYKYANDRVAGEFQSSLAYWHMGRIFDPQNLPALNADFVTCDPTTRIFAVQNGADHLYSQHLINASVVRCMPKFSIPSI